MYLGIDIGGTKTFVACLDAHGVIQECVRFPTPRFYSEFLREAAKAVATLSTKNFIAGCVAVPGKVDRTRGIGIVLGNLPWRNVPIQRDIQKMAGCPVIIENDANLAGLSEAMLVKQYSKVLYVTISTGIGTGIIIDQRIDSDFADSEGGHMVLEHKGKLMRWEHFASGKAIVERFGKRAQDISDDKTWKIIARDIALGLTELIVILQPEAIIIGGGVGSYFERYEQFLIKELHRYETPLVNLPVLQKARRPEEAVVFGCYDAAKSAYEAHP